MVYLDADHGRMSPADWIHFGNWGNHEPDWQTGRWALHTMAVRDRKLEFAHVSPFHGVYIGPAALPDFPLRQWVRFSVCLHYRGNPGFVPVWLRGMNIII